jgi:hypothetical protein
VPKRIPEEDLEAILGVVEHHPGGASRMAIAETLTPKLASRTLQFRLKYLVDAGRLVKPGCRLSRSTGQGGRGYRSSIDSKRSDPPLPPSASRGAKARRLQPSISRFILPECQLLSFANGTRSPCRHWQAEFCGSGRRHVRKTGSQPAPDRLVVELKPP